MAEDLDLPDEVYGFGSWLLWVLATRATAVVDRAYEAGPARPSRHYGTVDGHPVPTPSLVAWLLTAAEAGIQPDQLAGRDARLDERQKVLRTIVSRAVGGEPRLFKDGWLRQLATVCGLGDPELDLLARCRDDEGYPVQPQALRKAIAHTYRSRANAGHRADSVVSAGQVVVGEIPREPPGFVARDMLGRLADAAGRGSVAVVCAVTGLRGVGKTQLAAAYARARVAEGCALVGWVNAETADTLLAGLARVAGRLGVADPEGDSAESARRLREHLQARAGKGLLVLDNATRPAELRTFLPATGETQVVITSTDQAFTELGEVVDVTVFTRAESLGYLAARTGLADQIGAAMAADELGDWPLGLAQAAATIRRQHLTYATYLERLRRVPVAALLGSVPGGEYPHPAAAALLLSIQATEAGERGGLTGRLLRVVAALSADGVDRRLLDGLAVADGREGEVDEALERCVAGSLLGWSVTGDAVIMHRLLARVLRERDHADGQWDVTVSTALGLLEPALFPEEQAWARREDGAHLASHAEVLWEAGGGDGTADPELRLRQLRARRWAVRQLRAAADLGRAVELGQRVLADCEQALGADHPDTCTARDSLAGAYASAGRLEQAIPLSERTLADRERVLGTDHPDTITARDSLAATYQRAGRLEQAILLYEQAVADFERVLGGDHPQTLRSRDCLAGAYASAERLEQAIPLFERLLADCERVLGADHPQTITARQNIAFTYDAAGLVEQAIPLYEQAAADFERVLGADHPETLTVRNNLGHAYREAGQLEKAIPLHERTLADRERVLGADHPDTLVSRGSLALAYAAAGRLEQAIPLHEQVVADSERVMGADHPLTLSSRNHLGVFYTSAGQPERAIALHERTLADRERLLGADHPHTFNSRNNLARAFRSAGLHERAIRLHEETLADRQRVLGADHPDTLTSRDDLACAQASAGRSGLAIRLHQETLADRQRVLGADHPDTLASQENLAIAYQSSGRLQQAIQLFAQTLADRQRVLGADHPDTRASRANLEQARTEADTRPLAGSL
jgi:tetratricopeptide (TPR) repeat protein